MTRGAAGAIIGDTDQASTFSGTANGLRVVQPDAAAGPNTFTAEAWFKTTTNQGGKILGFGSSSTGSSSNYDRQVYMTNAGQLYFGVYPDGVQTLNTHERRYNDGQWHHVVGLAGRQRHAALRRRRAGRRPVPM